MTAKIDELFELRSTFEIAQRRGSRRRCDEGSFSRTNRLCPLSFSPARFIYITYSGTRVPGNFCSDRGILTGNISS